MKKQSVVPAPSPDRSTPSDRPALGVIRGDLPRKQRDARAAAIARAKPATIRLDFEVEAKHAPALKSAIDEISNEIGERLKNAAEYAVEDAWTYAAVGLGKFRAAISTQVPYGDPNYRAGRPRK